MSSYLRALGLFSRNARLYLVSAGLMGFTVFGGIYSLLRSLFLLRLGYGPEFIGLAAAIAMLGWALASLPAGAICQRLGSRRSMVLGLGLASLGYFLWPFALWLPPSWRSAWLILIYLFSDVTIALYDVGAGPFLMNATTSKERSHVFSVQAALWPVAGFAGSLIGGLLPSLFAVLLQTTTQNPSTFAFPLMIAATSLSVGALALYASHEGPPGAEEAQETSVAASQVSMAPFHFMVFVGTIIFLGGVGEGAVRTFFSVYLDAALHTATATIGTLAAIGQLLAVPAALAMPLLAGRWGHRRIFQWGTYGMALSLLPLVLIPHWSAAGLGYMLMIALVSLTRPALSVYIMENIPAEWRATVSAVSTMSIGLCWSIISLGGGFMIAALGYPPFFFVSAILTGIGAVIFGMRQIAVKKAEPVTATSS